MKRDHPLPLGEGRGEGFTLPKTLPLFPLPKGKGMKRNISVSLWERVGERVLRAPKTLPLFPLPKGKGMNYRPR